MTLLTETRRVRLSTTPLVEAAPLDALASAEMPTESHFVRTHFPIPALAPERWRLRVSGRDGRGLALSLDDLKRLPEASLAVVLECAGHRRAEYEPPAHGIAWGVGAMSEAIWTGARLADVLELVELGDATHVVLEGADSGPVGDRGVVTTFARSLPLDKAVDDDTLLAWDMNGRPLPPAHGAPLRAIVPGWYATDSVKWLTRIRAQVGPFDGHFEAVDYRLADESGGGGCRLTTLPVSSLLTSHADGDAVEAGLVRLSGIAWGAKARVAAVELSIDGGGWMQASLARPRGPYARVFWCLDWDAPPGPHDLRIRARDWSGRAQPERARWNPRGFANSGVHRVRLDARR
jgi:DMSO/TMAO reductase YedYZ molybdopterin-dependent catalytic subunit